MYKRIICLDVYFGLGDFFFDYNIAFICFLPNHDFRKITSNSIYYVILRKLYVPVKPRNCSRTSMLTTFSIEV